MNPVPHGKLVKTRRGATRRDLPLFCVLYGIVFAVVSITISLSTPPQIFEKSDLVPVSGSVAYVDHVRKGKNAWDLVIKLRDKDGTHFLSQDDFSCGCGGAGAKLNTIRRGDELTALVTPNTAGLTVEEYWSVTRGEVDLLTYKRTRSIFENRIETDKRISTYSALASAILLIAGIALRRHFGGWRDRSRPAMRVNTQ